VSFSLHVDGILHFLHRRETLWPELDNLLRDEDDVDTASTPYMATISKYRVVIHDSSVTRSDNEYNSTANGHTSYDIHHPCRYSIVLCLHFKYWLYQDIPVVSL